MRTRRLTFLFIIGLAATLAISASAAQEPSRADITKLVAEAATYQSGQSREPLRRIEELVG